METKIYTLWIVLRGGGGLRFDMDSKNASIATKMICGAVDTFSRKGKRIFVTGLLKDKGRYFVDCSEIAGFYSVLNQTSPERK